MALSLRYKTDVVEMQLVIYIVNWLQESPADVIYPGLDPKQNEQAILETDTESTVLR